MQNKKEEGLIPHHWIATRGECKHCQLGKEDNVWLETLKAELLTI